MATPDPQAVAERILQTQACGRSGCACARSLRQGHGLTHCVVHSDPGASLNVTIKDNRLLVHCQATCPQDQVVATLHERNLWPERASTPASSINQRTVVATYDYRDAGGALVFQTLRYHPKAFAQRQPDGNGGWQWNLRDVQPVLYRLPELLAADPRQTVYIVEGEKDADRLRAEGLIATSSPMGAGKWRKVYAEALRDRRVVVLHDQDAVGEEHAQVILRSLRGVASSARVITLPDLAEHGDVSDWLDAHPVDELRALCSPVPRTWNAAELMQRQLPPPRWAIPGLIAEGLTVLAGRPKFGKSWIALQMALAIAYGGRALSQIKVDAGESLYLGLEDNERRLQARLRMVVGDDGPLPRQLDVTAEWPRQDEGGMEALEAWLDERPNARLVVIDTWTMFRAQPPKGSDAYFEDTRAARRLKQLADQRHIAIVVLHHTRKPFLGGSVSDFLDEVLGSSGLTAAADSILVLQRQRGERNAVLHFTGRDILEESRALEWDDVTCWSLGGSAEEAQINRERQAMLAALRRLDQPSTPTEVASEMDKSLEATKKLLQRMSRDALVLNDGRGHYSAPIPADAGYIAAVAHSRNGGNSENQENGVPRVPESPNGDSELKVAQFSGTPQVGSVPQAGGLGGLGDSGDTQARARARGTAAHGACVACRKSLSVREQHWPWLHDGCRIRPVANGPPG